MKNNKRNQYVCTDRETGSDKVFGRLEKLTDEAATINGESGEANSNTLSQQSAKVVR